MDAASLCAIHLSVPYPDPLSLKKTFLAPDFPAGLRGLRFLKADLTSKDCGEGIDPDIFHILPHQGPCPVQQQTYIYPSLPSVIDLSAEALLVALQVYWEIQLQVGFGFPSPIPACLGSVSIFILGDFILHPPLVPFLLYLGKISTLLILTHKKTKSERL